MPRETETPHNPLHTPLILVGGVGPERAALLGKLGLHTVEDVMLHRPRRYEDRRHFKKISQLPYGAPATGFGKVIACGLKSFKKGTRSVFEIILDDGTARLYCRWWNLPFMEKYFQVGDDVLAFGKIGPRKPRTMDHPETEVMETGEEISVHLNRIAPIYPLTEGLPQRWLRALIWRVLRDYEKHIVEPRPELLQKEKLAKFHFFTGELALTKKEFPSRSEAIRRMHFPAEFSDAETGRQRLALDEFLELQLSMQLRRKKLEINARALPCSGDNRLIKQFLVKLGFQLTEAQTKVLREIRADLGANVPMRRLLQGDVGAGKTVVAACSALMTIESGFNVALMAPTEILAEQHFQNFRKWFRPLGISVELLTGSVKTTATQSETLLPQGNSEHTLFIGTHALIEAAFIPKNLGLVIIDEQHKFGVTQREKLVRKGNYPHLLVMTATPIPRTLALTLYGDLDLSVIDQRPGGRGEVKTFVRTEDKLAKIWEFVLSKLNAGRQAYIVYARVENTSGDVKAVTTEFEQITKHLAPHPVALLHGRIKAEEKEQIMAGFRSGKIKALVATSVIEVGVDVPNATVMVIENAERFGLAQLHQLRGRIGRGAHESYCILVASAKNDETMRRLTLMEKTNDGFKIAEEDLKLRGAGELVGQQQSGAPPIKFGDLASDRNLVEAARELVRDFLRSK